MALYDFECDVCKTVTEHLVRKPEEAPKHCEKCGAELRRLVGRAGFSLKGFGWAWDGYGSPPPDTEPG
jgi:putative FmdB family regulatory protein